MDKLGDQNNSNLLPGEVDLLAALDTLDEVAPHIQQEGWYKRLSAALDLHFKPKLAPPGTTINIYFGSAAGVP